MGDLIFVLPILIIFFTILFKIFLFLKKIFGFFAKAFNLTIEKADADKSDSQSKAETIDYLDNYSQTLETKDKRVENPSTVEKKEQVLKQKQKMQPNAKIKKNIEKNKEKKKKNKRKKVDSLAGLFSDYSEAEKAVIYNEILSKPKSLQKD